MKLRIFTEPQEGASYDDLLAAARATETAGLDGFFRSEHYLAIGKPSPASMQPFPGPTDAWTTFAGLARDTERIRLGTLVSPATFRHPAQLAIVVAQVDAMSGGRVELGLGAGWFEAEHLAYGIPFPPSVGERIDRLVEQLEIVTGLWATPAGGRFSYEGRHYRLADSPALPKPLQRPRPPIVVGGGGLRRLPANAARLADECNIGFRDVAHVKAVSAALDAACEAIGRDPASLRRSVALTLCCAEDPATLARRAAAIGRDVATLRAEGAAGSPEEVAARLSTYAEAGVERAYLQVMDLTDLEHVHLAGERLAPLVAGL